MWSALNPGSNNRALRTLRMNRLAEISSRSENASCTATRPVDAQVFRAAACPPSVFRPDMRSPCVAFSAGARPKATALPSASAAVNASTGRFRWTWSATGRSLGGTKEASSPAVQIWAATAAAAAHVTSTRFSVISWRTRRLRLHPIDSRTANSCRRAAARDSWRLATLAHAITRMMPTTPMRTRSTGPRIDCAPCGDRQSGKAPMWGAVPSPAVRAIRPAMAESSRAA